MFLQNYLLAGVSLPLVISTLGQVVEGPDYNSPTNGPPPSFFAASTSINVPALKSAVSKLSDKLATYPISQDLDTKSVIYGDWSTFSNGAAIVWTADMDVDCDGIDYECKGNPDGLPLTTWGALAAYQVPWIVMPDEFATAHAGIIPGNNVAAVICNGNMYYGIIGDTNGNTPQITGEASWLMARTCFPDEDLNGNAGHVQKDVTYILFLGNEAVLPASAINENYITNFTTLKSMGNRLVNALMSSISSGGSPSTTPSGSSTPTSVATPGPTGGSCSWPGHCEGASCSTWDDCSDNLICSGGVCSVDSSSTEGCTWEGHCAGASCSTNSDCSDNLVCDSGVCSESTTSGGSIGACPAS